MKKNRVNARPHPGPLPQGEGERDSRLAEIRSEGRTHDSGAPIARQRRMIHPLPGERARVRASVSPLNLPPLSPPRRYLPKTTRTRWLHARRLVLALLATFMLSLPPARAAEEEPPQKPLFLPKSPRGAAYVLSRLSNQELIEAPRSEFVYVAMLERKGLDKKYRIEALEGLAKVRNTDTLTELFKGIQELDQKGEESEPVLRDLAALLLQNKPADLAAKRTDLEKLAGGSQLPFNRHLWSSGASPPDASSDKTR